MLVDIILPRAWEELSQSQLKFALQTIEDVNRRLTAKEFGSKSDFYEQSAAQIQLICMVKWAGLRLVCPWNNGWMLAKGSSEFFANAATLASACRHLDWMRLPPSVPVRLDRCAGGKAVDANLEDGVDFEHFLAIENLWQGYMHTTDIDLLRQMAEILYPGSSGLFESYQLLGVFFWWSGVKSYLRNRFSSFFQPSPSDSSPDMLQMQRSVDAQIRALTKGDPTKEVQVLSLNCIRALTELDAQCREYIELNKKFPTK